MTSDRRPGDAPPAIEALGVTRTYPSGDRELHVLRGLDLRVEKGEAVAVVGQSGCGKSTLLHILGALDHPTAGEVRIGGEPLGTMSSEALAALRNREVGFVFQFHHLLREFSALENVMMPMLISGLAPAEAEPRAWELLDAVGLSERADHGPSELSGGEQQRVAVARALANRPVVLLADEPSGNLDRETSQALHDLLFSIREERGLAMVLVTHDLQLAGRADRILTLVDGRLDGMSSSATFPGGSGVAEDGAAAPAPDSASAETGASESDREDG